MCIMFILLSIGVLKFHDFECTAVNGVLILWRIRFYRDFAGTLNLLTT
jgi:hypothetical protein